MFEAAGVGREIVNKDTGQRRIEGSPRTRRKEEESSCPFGEEKPIDSDSGMSFLSEG
jgi:hypothetical protein